MNLCLKCQPLKDAYTTIIYDRQQHQTSKPVRSKDPIEAAGSDENKTLKKPKPASREKQRMLAAISSSGYCVVYRNNGNARFVCTELGGCLCNRSGSVYYQWKWDEVKLRDYEKFKNELIVDVSTVESFIRYSLFMVVNNS